MLKPGIIGQGADIIATPFVWLYYGCSGLSQFCAHTKQYFSPAKDTAQELAHDEPSLTSNKDDKVVERNNTSDLEKIMQKQKL